ncbi:hypothetical protein C7M84_019448 [Penaeus vannamei]|uniref:Uncharacterized protein n=1 Tax=Penaeus vannamei TaxID=6689 RepID=A0A3R7LYW4_PENVA|nr:hypothetical protein C7M84_019448 [Penaeus vannamei]
MGEADVESLASTDISVLDEEKEKIADEETDLSLASSPSLPDDLPAIKPDTQYRHTPDRDLNSRLNIVVALTLACVLGLGLGHFLGLVDLSVESIDKGWSSRSMWQDTLNSAQVRKLRELQDDLVSCMNSPLQPPPAPAPGFSFDTPQPPLMDTYPPEADLHESAYPGVDAPFVPVLPESEENLLIVESFVESLVTPLEDAGVVLSATRRKADMAALNQGPAEGFGVATDPTFATPDLMREEDFEASLSRSVAEDRNIFKEDKEIIGSVQDEDAEADEVKDACSQESCDPLIREEGVQGTTESPVLPPLDQSGQDDIVEDACDEDLAAAVEIENLQLIEKMNQENGNLELEVSRLQQENVTPFKITGKDGKHARDLRERINRLIVENEELRMAIGKLQFSSLPDGDTGAFNTALDKNYNLRVAVGKLT